MSFYGMMFRRRSHVSTTFTQIMSNHQTRKAEEFFQTASSKFMQIPSSLRLAVVKVQVIELTETWARPWSAAAHSARQGSVDTEAAAAGVAAAEVAAEDIHSIGHVAPYKSVLTTACGRRSARLQLTPAIGLAKVAQIFWRDQLNLDSKCLCTIQSSSSFYQN